MTLGAEARCGAVMIAFFKLALFGYIGLTVIYWLLAIYSRSVERERLEKEYDQGDVTGQNAQLARLTRQRHKLGWAAEDRLFGTHHLDLYRAHLYSLLKPA